MNWVLKGKPSFSHRRVLLSFWCQREKHKPKLKKRQHTLPFSSPSRSFLTASKPSGHNSQDILNRKNQFTPLSPCNSKCARHRPGLPQRSEDRRQDGRLPNNSKPKTLWRKAHRQEPRCPSRKQRTTMISKLEPEMDKGHRQAGSRRPAPRLQTRQGATEGASRPRGGSRPSTR